MIGDAKRTASPAATAPSDPVERAIGRMRRSQEGKPQSDLRSGRDKANARDTDDLQQQIQRAETRLAAVIASLNSATIDATCNEDGTITVTLTLPSFPGS